MKFLGLPPPHNTTPLRPPPRLAASTKAVVSLTSIDGFMRSLLPRNSTPATFIPIVLPFPFGAIPAQQIVQLRCAHLLLEFGLNQNFPKNFVRGHQSIGIG